jgi:KaiC/GvpD/RAD55 family RecA-like ATPase
MVGEIKSLITPWEKFNDAGTGGIEWNTMTVIGGRPASGKTLIVEQIVRESFFLMLVKTSECCNFNLRC